MQVVDILTATRSHTNQANISLPALSPYDCYSERNFNTSSPNAFLFNPMEKEQEQF